MLIKGRTKFDVTDGQYYVFQKDYKVVKLKEDEKDFETEIDVSDLFKNATYWKWGIKSPKYYSVFLTAIGFHYPRLTINVPNALISIKKDGEFVYINALIFHERKDKAFEFAHQFRLANRESVAFEVTPTYQETPLQVEDLFSLLEGIDRKIEKVLEKTEEAVQKASEISIDTKAILDRIEKVEKKIERLFDFILPDKDSYEVQLITSQGVYVDGKKIYLNLLGETFDYFEPDERSFISFFGYNVREFDVEQLRKELKKATRTKFLGGEKYISPDEAEKITGQPPKNNRDWKIVFIVKEKRIEQLVTALKQVVRMSHQRLVEVMKQAVRNAVKEHRNRLTIDDVMNVLTDSEREKFQKLEEYYKKVFFKAETNYDVKNSAVVVSDKSFADLLLYALALEVEKRTEKPLEVIEN